jgi:hypothetical protein
MAGCRSGRDYQLPSELVHFKVGLFLNARNPESKFITILFY